ncbi:hypothetical protein Hanom_Chr07g00676031 [Helianthus anomalus]
MELTSRMKIARFQTFWIQMRKNKPLDEIRKTGQTAGTKMAFYSPYIEIIIPAALRSRTEAGGVFNTNVKLLSCKFKQPHNNYKQTKFKNETLKTKLR